MEILVNIFIEYDSAEVCLGTLFSITWIEGYVVETRLEGLEVWRFGEAIGDGIHLWDYYDRDFYSWSFFAEETAVLVLSFNNYVIVVLNMLWIYRRLYHLHHISILQADDLRIALVINFLNNLILYQIKIQTKNDLLILFPWHTHFLSLQKYTFLDIKLSVTLDCKFSLKASFYSYHG